MNVKFVLVFIGILFVSVAVKAQTTDSPSNVSSGPQECGENAEWNECGSMCPPKCPQRFMGPGPVCNKMCVPSCQCVKGYLKSFDGKCVRPKECPRISIPIIPLQPGQPIRPVEPVRPVQLVRPQLPTPETM